MVSSILWLLNFFQTIQKKRAYLWDLFKTKNSRLRIRTIVLFYMWLVWMSQFKFTALIKDINIKKVLKMKMYNSERWWTYKYLHFYQDCLDFVLLHPYNRIPSASWEQVEELLVFRAGRTPGVHPVSFDPGQDGKEARTCSASICLCDIFVCQYWCVFQHRYYIQLSFHMIHHCISFILFRYLNISFIHNFHVHRQHRIFTQRV